MTAFQAVLLAAGRGTRMNSTRPKVLDQLAGEPMLEGVLGAVEQAGAERVLTVVGKDSDDVRASFDGRTQFVVQDPPRGTGHAVMAASALLHERLELPTLILNGDLPLLRPETVSRLLAARAGAAA